ncbi:MAG: hypothetical protein U0V74_04815 [Chitinophagales bacterium]
MKNNIIIFLIALLAPFATQAQSVQVLEGKGGFWFFYSQDMLGPANPKDISKAVISRSENGGDFKEIGTASAMLDIQQMKQSFGADFPGHVAYILHLKDENSVVDYMKKNVSLKTYGLLMLDMDFYRATGAVYFDSYKANAGTRLKYRVKFLKADGSAISETAEAEVVSGKTPQFNKPHYYSRYESDSMISVKWISTGPKTETAFYGNVYRSNAKGGFDFAGSVLPAVKKDTVLYTWEEPVTPGTEYKYFVKPASLVMLEGNPSDTAVIISSSFSKTLPLQNFKATDTTGGILFTWKPLEANPLYVGICIQRKPISDANFLNIDTIPLTAASYMDSRLIPNILYQYQFSLVNIRFNTLVPSTAAALIHRSGKVNPFIPFATKATAAKTGIEVRWNRVRHYDVNGYYVYRSTNGEEFRQYSELLKDTVYVDTAATNGRMLYSYKIASIDFNDVQSELSNDVQARPTNTILPTAVNGLTTFTEAGKTTLAWNDMKRVDNFVVGYNVYRKKGEQAFTKYFTSAELVQNGFVKLNSTPLINSAYADVTSGSGSFTYAVTSVDMNGAESTVAQLEQRTAETKMVAPPSFFSLVKTDKGVEVRWSDELQKEVTDYSIYRRMRNEETPKLIGTVKASQQVYLDATAAAGTFYFYSVKAKAANGKESEATNEKGISR